jgi:maltooligosyltrehalose trehalohydrolase
VPGHRFVVYLQDHDQVGNRATGDRISATLSDGLLKVGAALVLTSPYTPMLWMGEEWGARTPWQFFSDNHLGPAGNYLPEFGPYLTEAHTTPWGPAVNLDRQGSDEVRRYVIDNALMWLRDYHVDGLRIDAVHALVDERATHLLEELAVEVEALGAQLRKPLFLIAESDLNDPRMVTSREGGGHGLQAQWADDVHHALHATLTGESAGYYGDFVGLPVVSKVLTDVFLHDGTWSSFRGRAHGRPVPPSVPGHRFVVYLQDHDQIGNRATGDRISASLSDGLLKVGAALVLTSPYTPMLFMGEEWGARTPWQFFSDHEGDLGEAVRKGRRAEFASHGWSTEEVPDPQSEQTVRDSTLDWSEPGQERHAALLSWTRDLIALRRSRPELSDGRRDRVEVAYDEAARWLVVRRGQWRWSATSARTPPWSRWTAARSASCSPASRARPTVPARWSSRASR